MKIILPLPSRLLSPNARIHRQNRAKITKLHRHRAKLRTLEALNGGTYAATGYSLAFYWPDARRHDDDNADASTKAYRDGIADALHIDDFKMPKVALSVFAIDRENPRLEITLHGTPQ